MNPEHTPKRNSPARVAMLEERIRARNARVGGLVVSTTPRTSLSRRGDRSETWQTKEHTKSRKLDYIQFCERQKAELLKKLAEAAPNREAVLEPAI